MTFNFDKVIEAINCASTVTIFSHINTDGDSVGSSLALFNYCKDLGKKVGLHIESSIPHNLKWINGVNYISEGASLSGDVALVVDCNSADRVGAKKFKLKNFKTIVNIDHHADNNNFGVINCVKPGYSSTCELIFDMFEALKIAVSPEMARCLIVGILTDTGNLSYANTVTPELFEKVAKLLRISGNQISDFTQPLFASNPYSIFELKKCVYKTAQFSTDLSRVILSLSYEDLVKSGADKNDTKSMIEIGFNIEPVKVLVAITEAEPNVCYVSFRSKGDINACAFAQVYGGGGHFNASGCRVYDSLQNVISSVKKVVDFK